MHHCGLSCDIRGYERHNELSSVDWNDEKFIWNYWNQSASEFKCYPLQFLDCVFTDLNTSDHLLWIVSAVWDRTQSQTEVLLFGLEIDTTQLMSNMQHTPVIYCNTMWHRTIWTFHTFDFSKMWHNTFLSENCTFWHLTWQQSKA